VRNGNSKGEERLAWLEKIPQRHSFKGLREVSLGWARRHASCLLGFLAGVGVGLLIFLGNPDLFISIFSRWS